MCWGQGIQLPATLAGALADPSAQDFLNNGCNVTLLPVAEATGNHPYSVPKQNLGEISKDTGYIIHFVDNILDITDPQISYGDVDGKERIDAVGYQRTQNGNIEFKYFHSGPDNLVNTKYQNMILARRIARIFELFFSRASRINAIDFGELDPITEKAIYNKANFETQPLVIYSR